MDKLFRKDRLRSESSIIVPQYDVHSQGSTLVDEGPTLNRAATLRSAENSTVSTSSTQSRPESISGVSDPLGLQVVYSPDDIEGDIIFIHGLGGSAWKTWSKDRDESSFWPLWLPEQDASLARFRISTFGYNARFKGSATNLNLLDFAKDLLFQLENILVPNSFHPRPVIFVSHSLGGLVAKKAFTLGKHDKQYARITSMMRGMIFLATPHRGSQYAKILNGILSTLPLGSSSKTYVGNLVERSDTLQEVNESFRNQCHDLLLCSFYETLKANLGLTRNFIVEKYSAVLGYDSESSASMDADHHSICKYKDVRDPNFIKIKAVLHNWVSQMLSDVRLTSDFIDQDQGENTNSLIEEILGLSYFDSGAVSLHQHPDSSPGSWLFSNTEFVSWLDCEHDPDSKTFLLVGPPGSGKTMISQSIHRQLASRGLSVQYHSFDRTDQLKRTAAFAIRSLAAQVARTDAKFKALLLELHKKTGITFNNQNHNFQNTWERLLDGMLFQIPKRRPIFWILDGVDESDASAQLLSRIFSLQSQTPIRVLIITRPLKSISLSNKKSITTHFLQVADTYADMDEFVTSSICAALPGEPVTQDFVRSEILKKAGGSFLWAKLVLEMLQDNWHTSEDIMQALNKVPLGMAGMYGHMVASIEEQNHRNFQLAKQVLSWVTCSWRPLLVSELAEALKGEFGTFTNLAVTITQICGHFVVLDRGEDGNTTASIIHITAREYLINSQDGQPPWIDTKLTHQNIAKSCLVYLSDDKWRKQLGNLSAAASSNSTSGTQRPKNLLLQMSDNFPLLAYATWHWAYHLSKCGSASQEMMEVLENFLLCYSMTWVEATALSGNMVHLIRSARYLKSYVKKSSKASWSDTQWIQLWAVDFIRIAGKFAPNLILSPSSVYRNIPALCPKKSMVGKTFGLPRPGSFSITGISMDTWEDCLASVLIDNNEYATQVLANDTHFFTVASSSGFVTVWNAETCEKCFNLCHDDPILKVSVSSSGSLLVAATFSKYYIWDTISNTLLHSIAPLSKARIRDLTFDARAAIVLAAYEDFTVETINLQSGQVTSMALDVSVLEPSYSGCPWRISISPDLTKIAMAWRGCAPLFWDLNQSRPVKCRTRNATDSLLYPEHLAWHPETGNLLVLCNDTSLLEWRIFDDEILRFPNIKARDMVVSKDGSLLLTAASQGTLNVWAFPRLNLLYTLANSGDRVTDLAFSPDSQRFYDVRGSSCNVWTPDALVRFDDQENEEASSLNGSVAITEPVMSAKADATSIVSAIATTSAAGHYACGREDGTVCIHEASGGKRVRKVYSHPASNEVTMLHWSHSGKYLVSCDDSSLVVVKRLQLKEDGKWAVFPVMEKRVHAPVQQLLFSNDEKKLFISTSTKYMLWDMKAKEETDSVLHQDGPIGYWILNSKGHLLMIEDHDIYAYDWEIKPKPISPASKSPLLEAGVADLDNRQKVVWSFPFNNGHHIFTALCRSEDYYASNSHQYSEIRIIHLGDVPRWKIPPQDMSSQIKMLFTIIDDQVVFLGLDGWVCSINLSPWVSSTSMAQSTVEIRRHFYIPKDWINTPAAKAAASNSQGTFFFPKQGEVAIVKNGLRF